MMNNQILHERYRLQSLLGRKQERRTYLARDLQTDSLVVIKVLLFGSGFTWDDWELFEQEAKTLKALNHPKIPQYLDFFEVDTKLGKGFALVQSYIEARSLQDWMQSGHTFSEADLRVMSKELLEILDFLHTRQPPVIHRDVKPSNIILSTCGENRLGQVYLVDFSSVQTAASSKIFRDVGSFGFMAPEQFSDRTTPASDLYSLGATLIYLLTRTHPADLPSRNGLIYFEAGSTASEPLQTWIRCLIQPDLSQRFQSAQSALEALPSNQFTLFKTVRSKPSGSGLILTKTDEQLQIFVPRPRAGRIQLFCSTMLLTAIVCSPLVVSFWYPKVGLFFAPSVMWMVFLAWIPFVYKIFEETKLSINQREICLTRRWLGFERKYIAKTEDTIKLERLCYRLNNQSSVNSETQYFNQYPGLYLGLGNQRYCLEGSISDLTAGVRHLTEVELDCLAVELSEWLNLPVQTNGEVAILDDQNRTNAPCTLNKSTEIIEISAPAEERFGWTSMAVLISVIFPFFLGTGSIISPVVALFLGAVLSSCWGCKALDNHLRRNNKIVLRIDQHEVSLWEQFQSSQQQQCLKTTSRSRVYALQLIYNEQQEYHIEICTRNSGKAFKEGFLVGNRSYWLSSTEAEWLARELSTWLKLPLHEYKR